MIALVALPRAALAAPHGGAPAPGGLELFVHPHGGGWSSHVLQGVAAGVGAPSIAASGSGELVLAERAPSGDVIVAEGTLFGVFTSTDVSQVLAVPPALGRPVAFVSSSGSVSVWYRSTSDDLEVVTQPSGTGAFSAIDVTAATDTTALLGDPTVTSTGGSPAGYAVTGLGTVTAYTPPVGEGGSWTAEDPTDGLAYPPLVGTVAAFAAPGLPAAGVVLGVEGTGALVELTDEVAGRPPTVGAWSATELSSDRAPFAASPIQSDGGVLPELTYTTEDGDVEAVTLRSGLAGDVSGVDLTRVSELDGAIGAIPALVDGAPGGPAVAARTMTGDLDLASIDAPTVVRDLSFEPHTQELVASDVAATTVGDGPTVLVAEDGGPIARTPLERRIAMIAASFDQQHRGFQTKPAGSYCNPFTASFGRGWTDGCPRGYAAEEWCSDFAQYVWRAAGIDTSGITGWAATFVTWGAKHHTVHYGTHSVARVGDAIVWGQRSPLYGQHVGIIVGVDGTSIEVVSGDSDGGFPHYGNGVWRWGPFVGSTSTVYGYHVLAIVQP